MRRPRKADERRPRRGLLWLLLGIVALVLRVAAAYWRPGYFGGDQQLYLLLAESMHQGAGYVNQGAAQVTVHPLLPTLHAAALGVFDHGRLTGIAVTLLIGTLLPLVAGWTISMMIGFRPGYAAAWLLALEPFYIVRSSRIEPDLLAGLLCFWIASLIWRESYALAGAVLGLAYLNRPEMFLLAPVVFLVARIRGASWIQLGRGLVFFLALCSVFILYVRADTDRWALSGKDRWQYMLGVHQWRSGNQPLPRSELPRMMKEISSPLAHLQDNPREFMLGYLYRSTLVLRGLALQLGFVLIPFLVYGAIRIWKSSPTALILLCLPVFLLPVIALVGTFVRHTFAAGTSLVAVSGVGLVLAWTRFRTATTPRTS